MPNNEKLAKIEDILNKISLKDSNATILSNFWIALVQANINFLEEDYENLKQNSMLFRNFLSTKKIVNYNLGTFLRYIDINIYNELVNCFASLDECIIAVNRLFHLYADPIVAISRIKKSKKSIVCLSIKMLVLNQDIIADIYHALNSDKNNQMFVERSLLAKEPKTLSQFFQNLRSYKEAYPAKDYYDYLFKMYLHIDNNQIPKAHNRFRERITWDEVSEEKKLDLYNRITLNRPISLRKKAEIIDEKFRLLPENKQQQIIAYLYHKEDYNNAQTNIVLRNITNIYNNFRNYTNRRVSEVLRPISKVAIELQISLQDDLSYDDIEIFFDTFMSLMTEYCNLVGCSTNKYYEIMHSDIKDIFLEFPKISLKDLIIIYIERTSIKIAALKNTQELCPSTPEEVVVLT